jgi:hypothetical protein
VAATIRSKYPVSAWVLPLAHRLEGWASGIRQVSDFAGTYSSVGGGGAFVGGFGGIQLGNEKGVKIALQGPRIGMEFAANRTEVRISLK